MRLGRRREWKPYRQTVAMGRRLPVQASGEFPHQAQTLAPGLEFFDGHGKRDSRRFHGVGRHEMRRMVFNREKQRGHPIDAHVHRELVAGLSVVAVTDDVGERLFQTKVDGKHRVLGEAMLDRKIVHPGKNQRQVREPAAKCQPGLGRMCRYVGHRRVQLDADYCKTARAEPSS